MKRLLNASLVVLLSLVAHAHAVERVSDRPGDTLLFPFYSTENGLDTYINVAIVKARFPPVLRVRFIDAVTTDVTNSFNVYPTDYENWQAAITFDADEDRVELRISEGSCTLDEDLNIATAGDDIAIGASVGMVEVYALGLYSPDIDDAAPDRCEQLTDRWRAGGVWDTDPLKDMFQFSSFTREGREVVMGEAWLVNVSEGFASSYTPITLQNLTNQENLGENIVHTPPGGSSPNLSEADPTAFIDGMDVTPSSGEGIDAVALVMPLGDGFALINDVITSDVIAARTDWVISYPLAPYKNYKPFEFSDGENTIFCEGFGDWDPEPGENLVGVKRDSPVAGVLTWGMGETNFFGSLFDPTPELPEAARLCHPINVVSFGGLSPILVDEDSPLLADEPDPMTPSPADGDSITLRWIPYPYEFPEGSGINRPVFGFRMTTFLNGTLNDGRTLANYSVLRKHQTW